MSQIHTGVLGTQTSRGRDLVISVDARGMWRVVVTGNDQVFLSTSLDGALRKAVKTLGKEDVLGNLSASVVFLRNLMGVEK